MNSASEQNENLSPTPSPAASGNTSPAGSGNVIENNLSFGSVPKKLIMFALPFLLSNIIQSLYNVADMLIVGNFSGAAAMSGVNIGGQVTFILTNIIIGLCMGATILIGQYIGSGDREGLKSVTSTIITMLLALGVFFTVVMLLILDPVLRAIRTPMESYADSRSYLWVTLTGIIFIFGYNALAAMLRGMGDSKHPLWFVAIAGVANIILDLVFVALLGLGALGAALATVISQGMSMVLCIMFMKRNNFQFDFRLKSFRIDRTQMRLIIKVGLPSSIQNGVTSLSFLFLTTIVNIVGGVSASAAVGAVGKFNSFAFMPTAAIAGAVATMSAQNIGANRMDRAVSTCKIGCLMSMAITYAFFIFVQLKPEWVLSVFARDEQMIRDGVTYMSTFTYDFLIIPIVFNISGFLLAGGHSMFSMLTGLMSSVLLRIPTCYLFGIVLDHGLKGVGLGAPVASVGTLIVMIVYLSTGKWKRNAVADNNAVEMAGP